MTETKPLTSTEVHGVLLNGLYSAARTYQDLAKSMAAGPDGNKSLADQFSKQATAAIALAERIERAEGVVLTGESGGVNRVAAI